MHKYSYILYLHVLVLQGMWWPVSPTALKEVNFNSWTCHYVFPSTVQLPLVGSVASTEKDLLCFVYSYTLKNNFSVKHLDTLKFNISNLLYSYICSCSPLSSNVPVSLQESLTFNLSMFFLPSFVPSDSYTCPHVYWCHFYGHYRLILISNSNLNLWPPSHFLPKWRHSFCTICTSCPQLTVFSL